MQKQTGSAAIVQYKILFAFAALVAGGCSAPELDSTPTVQANEQRPPAAGNASRPAWAEAAVPLTGANGDYDPLLQAIGDARFVLLGESTHGTEEFYRERGRISERLVRERGFNAILIEGDWSPAFRINRYVRGIGGDRNADQALSGFTNFPQWMWPNTAFRDFVERLRAYNLTQPVERRVGVYGMDVYDLFEAQEAVLAYLARTDSAAASRARSNYRCFAPYGKNTARYGEAARRASRSCREEAAAVLADLRRIPRPADPVGAEEHFAARRSAASVAQGEEYFRTVYAGSMAWNVRDQHMANNVEETAQHIASLHGGQGRVVVWSHNTHSGDARATFAARQGELNLGQLLRQRHGDDAFLIGFITHIGQVRAAPEWGAAARVYDLKPSIPGSYADILRQAGMPAFSLALRANRAAAAALGQERLQRAVGVVYTPASERQSHYFGAQLTQQFDGIVFIERSSAVRPIR